MDTNSLSSVDFDPAHVSNVVEKYGHVIIHFQEQRAFHDKSRITPEEEIWVSAELWIKDGQIMTPMPSMPFECDEWEIQCDNETRSFFLPVGYSKTGKTRAVFKCQDQSVLKIIGSKIKLVVCSSD